MNHPERIYLDYAASTPVAPTVLESMLPYFAVEFGNPSSVHLYGQRAEAAVEQSRQQIADCLGCSSNEIIFTSCGSESDNLALRGIALAAREQRGASRILISPVEHHAISHTAEQLAALFGFTVEYLAVDTYGKIDLEELEKSLDTDTAIVSVIYANNEIGTINPIAAIGEICRSKDIPFHTDAVQAAAYLPINVHQDQVDLLSLGAHKFYGPKGIGALFIKSGTPLYPVITGGGQEFGTRAGTQNVPYIVGMATALQLAQDRRSALTTSLRDLRDRLITGVINEIPEAQLTGHPRDRLPNHASFVFRGVDGNALLTMLDIAGYACSSGSACKTGSPKPSEVLTAIGLEHEWALGSLRVSLGTASTEKIIVEFLQELSRSIQHLRKMGTL
jgi:cysteine desulfurase